MKISLKTLLNIAAAVCSILSYFMGLEALAAPYALLFLAFLAAAAFIEWRGLPHPPRLPINLATLAALVVIFARMRYSYMIETFVGALLLLIAVKMLEKKRARDYVQIAGLSFAMIVCYAMLSVEKAFIVYCFGTGMVATCILILAAWFDREPDAALSVKEARQVVVRTAALFASMMPLCLLLFFASPRLAAPLFGTRAQYGTAVTGFGDQVQLGDATSIQKSDKLAFRVEMPSLENREPYWRGTVLGYFEGNSWIASRGGNNRSSFIPDRDAPRVEQEIFLEAGNRGYLFALDQPLSITGVDLYEDGDGAFRYRSPNVGRRLQYRAVSVLSSRMKPSNPQFDKRRNLQLPPEFIPRLKVLVEEMTQGMSDRQKAAAVLKYLSPPEFAYSLEGLPNSRDALEQFVFESKKGNCEYFASAMGAMLRMASVPARLVAGYRGGFYNEAGGYYIVQEQNAHVWVEAWDEEAAAWVRYDPTPTGTAGFGPEDYGAFALYWDLLDYRWSQLIVNYNWELQAELAQNLREILRNPRASLSPTREGMAKLGGALSVPALALAGVAAAAMLFYWVRFMKARRPEKILLDKFQRVMKRHGYTRHESEGLEEFLARVDDEKLHRLALPFIRSFEDFYYGDRPLDAPVRKYLQNRIAQIADAPKQPKK